MDESFAEFYVEFLREIEQFEKNKVFSSSANNKKKRKVMENPVKREEKVIFASKRRKKEFSSIAVQT